MDSERSNEVARAYGEMSDRYIDLFAGTTALDPDDLALITRQLRGAASVVLDIGCGPGHLTVHLRSLGLETVGIDVTPEFLRYARRTDPHGHYVLGSADRLPIPDGMAGGVLAWYSLIHLARDDIDGALIECRRAAKRGAPMVLGCFPGDDLVPFDHAVATAYYWPLDELSARLASAGWTEIERHQRPGVDAPGRRAAGAIVAVAD